jgi:hypothetical protein
MMGDSALHIPPITDAMVDAAAHVLWGSRNHPTKPWRILYPTSMHERMLDDVRDALRAAFLVANDSR